MKKVRCIKNIPYFTQGMVYEVDHIDNDGDIWVTDDQGDPMFMFHHECEGVV